MMLERFPVWALVASIAFIGSVSAATSGDQGGNRSSASQVFGSIEVRLGMSEGEVLRLLTSQYAVSPILGAAGGYTIKEKDGSKDVIGSFTISQGRVSIISSDWTPSVSGSGAFGEVLLTLLSRLTSGSTRGGWLTGEQCSVNIADGLTVGTDTQLRMAEIICGRQRVSITTSRTNAGPSQSQLQLVTR